MAINYISLSGIKDRNVLAGVQKICEEERFTFPVVIGYQVSHRTINGGDPGNRQPRISHLRELCKESKEYGMFPAIHYYTRDNTTILSDLERLLELGVEPGLLQLNTLPPIPKTLEIINKRGYKIILKVAVSDKHQGGVAVWTGQKVEDVSTGDISNLIKQVYERKDFIQYVMFDPSHGTNLELDLNENSLAIRFGKEIIEMDSLSHLNLVYAGGIKPSNVKQLIRLLNSFFQGKFSIDAESGIRTGDQLNLELVRKYLTEYRDGMHSTHYGQFG